MSPSDTSSRDGIGSVVCEDNCVLSCSVYKVVAPVRLLESGNTQEVDEEHDRLSRSALRASVKLSAHCADFFAHVVPKAALHSRI